METFQFLKCQKIKPNNLIILVGFLVSKENVVQRRWDSETKIGFYQTN